MPDGDAVHPQSVVGATGRGLAVRARHRHSPRDGSLLVEPVRADVSRGDQETTGSSRLYSNWRWHLDEVFVKINGETHYLWRAVASKAKYWKSLH